MEDIRTGSCPICRHHEIVVATPRNLFGEIGDRQAPIPLTFDLETTFGKMTPDLRRPLGLLEAYSCRSCGFTQMYTQGIHAVPIGPAYGTRLLVGAKTDESGTPYR